MPYYIVVIIVLTLLVFNLGIYQKQNLTLYQSNIDCLNEARRNACDIGKGLTDDIVGFRY